MKTMNPTPIPGGTAYDGYGAYGVNQGSGFTGVGWSGSNGWGSAAYVNGQPIYHF